MNHRSRIKFVNATCVSRWLASFAAGMSILLIFPSCSSAQQSSKPRPSSGNSTRENVSSASASRTANVNPAAQPGRSPVGAGVLISFERINELTGFVPATDAEVQQLVATMQAAVKAKDATALKACFDEDEMLTRTIAGAELTPFQHSEMARGYRASNPCGLLANQAVRSDSDFQLFRLLRRGSELRPLFRLVTANEVVKYNELVLQTGSDQKTRVVDIVPSYDGDYVSLALRPLSLGPLVSERAPEKVPRTGIEPAIIESADALFDFSVHMTKGNLDEALEDLNTTQRPIAEHFGTQVLKCMVAKAIGLHTYRTAVLQFAEQYPDTVSSNLMLIELYQMEKKPAEKMAVADRLLNVLKDPWLDAYRIDGLVTQNRIQEARKAIAAAKTAAPNISDPYVAELGMLMKLKNHQETAQAIETLETKFGDKVVKLTEFPEFNEFSDSEVGHRFLAKRAGFDF